jgi:hypothetical protein
MVSARSNSRPDDEAAADWEIEYGPHRIRYKGPARRDEGIPRRHRRRRLRHRVPRRVPAAGAARVRADASPSTSSPPCRDGLGRRERRELVSNDEQQELISS